MEYRLRAIQLKDIRITGDILRDRQQVNRQVTVPALLQQCRATGRIDAIRHQWDGEEASRPHPFWDSDIGKTIESAAYALMGHPDPALEAEIDRIIDLMLAAQEPDGYFNSYYQACETKNQRWTNLYYMHELYCMGHLIEGAVAYEQATGKRAFLDMMCRYADLACSLFLPGGSHHGGYCGHPEIELALVRLAKATGEDRYLALARAFIDQRGQQPWYFETESLQRGVDTEKTANQTRHLKYFLPSRGPYAEYQAHLPLRQQEEPVGHAVRAMYLLSGMIDVAREDQDDDLMAAACRIMDATISTQMAITGGIGTAPDGERFTFAYDLPNEHTYNETCASVALMMAGLRMLQVRPNALVADAMEQVLYNTILSSLSLAGDHFFYANYLAVHPERFHHASKALIEKMAAVRQPWFNIACCPPNVSRLMGALGQYIASVDEAGQALYIHLYADCQMQLTMGGQELALAIQTDYPLDGRINIRFDSDVGPGLALWLRIPQWCADWTLAVNGAPVQGCHEENGYLGLSGPWQAGDLISLCLEMKPQLMCADPRVRQAGGKLAIMRGPVVYCLEEADNGKNLHDIALPVAGAVFTEVRDNMAGQLPFIRLGVAGIRYHSDQHGPGRLYQPAAGQGQPVSLQAIPYFLWGNRGFGEMRVWLNRA